jgi:hypothetical protein
MLQKTKFWMALCSTFCGSLLFAGTVAIDAQETTKETVKGSATVSTSQVKGEVVQVEGNDLLVKLSTGELKTFHVPETRKFVIDGKDLSVHDLQPGTTLTATVKTTTTPLTVRTKSSLRGRVWYASGPTVILTLPNGENKQYSVKDDDKIHFTLEGRPATVFDLRKGMTVSAEKIVEEPSVEISSDTSVVGHAPAAPLQASTPKEVPAPATPQPTPPEAAAPPAPQPAASETAAPAAAQPTAPETSGMSPLLWFALIGLLIVILAIVLRKLRRKTVM